MMRSAPTASVYGMPQEPRCRRPGRSRMRQTARRNAHCTELRSVRLAQCRDTPRYQSAASRIRRPQKNEDRKELPRLPGPAEEGWVSCYSKESIDEVEEYAWDHMIVDSRLRVIADRTDTDELRQPASVQRVPGAPRRERST